MYLKKRCAIREFCDDSCKEVHFWSQFYDKKSQFSILSLVFHPEDRILLLEKAIAHISYPYFDLVSGEFGHRNAANLADYWYSLFQQELQILV